MAFLWIHRSWHEGCDYDSIILQYFLTVIVHRNYSWYGMVWYLIKSINIFVHMYYNKPQKPSCQASYTIVNTRSCPTYQWFLQTLFARWGRKFLFIFSQLVWCTLCAWKRSERREFIRGLWQQLKEKRIRIQYLTGTVYAVTMAGICANYPILISYSPGIGYIPLEGSIVLFRDLNHDRGLPGGDSQIVPCAGWLIRQKESIGLSVWYKAV